MEHSSSSTSIATELRGSKSKSPVDAPESGKTKLRRGSNAMDVNGKTAQETVEFSARLTARIRHAEYQRLSCSCGGCKLPVPFSAAGMVSVDDGDKESGSEKNHGLSPDFIPCPTALSRFPLTLDALSVLFGSLDAVSSKFDHTNFQYRTLASQFARDGHTDQALQLHAYERERAISIVQRALRPYIPVRTRVLDDMVTQWCRTARDNTETQVVFLGGGFDTRAFRLSCLSNTTIFEVDQPDVIAFKNTLLPTQNEIVKHATVLPGRCKCTTCISCSSTNSESTSHTEHPVQCSKQLHRCVGDLGTRIAMHDKKVQQVYRFENNTAQLTVKHIQFEAQLLPNMAVTDPGYSFEVSCILASLRSSSDAATVAAVKRFSWLLALLEKGWRPWVPTQWIAEGVLMYLTRNQVEELLAMVSTFPNHQTIFDMYSTCTPKSGSAYYSLFKSGMNREEIPMLMRTCGFKRAKIAAFGKSGWGQQPTGACSNTCAHTYAQDNKVNTGNTFSDIEIPETGILVPTASLVSELVPSSLLPHVHVEEHVESIPDLPACINSPLCLCYYPDAARFILSDTFPLSQFPHDWACDLTSQYVAQCGLQNLEVNPTSSSQRWTLQPFSHQKTAKDRQNMQGSVQHSKKHIPPLFPLHYDRFSPNDGKNEGMVSMQHQTKCPKQLKAARKTIFNFERALDNYTQDPQHSQLRSLHTIENLASIRQSETETMCTCDPRLASVECFLIYVDSNK